MAPQIDFLPMAAEPAALVDTQANYAGSVYRLNGFPPGITLPTQFNKGFRQGTMGMAVLAAFIAGVLNENVLDSGYADGAAEVAALLAQFQAALATFFNASSQPKVIPVAWSAAPVLNFAVGNPLMPIFEITLGGDTTPTFTGVTAGQLATFILHQDGTGGHLWTWPGSAINAGAVDPAANSTSIESCVVGSNGSLYAIGGIAG